MFKKTTIKNLDKLKKCLAKQGNEKFFYAFVNDIIDKSHKQGWPTGIHSYVANSNRYSFTKESKFIYIDVYYNRVNNYYKII